MLDIYILVFSAILFATALCVPLTKWAIDYMFTSMTKMTRQMQEDLENWDEKDGDTLEEHLKTVPDLQQ